MTWWEEQEERDPQGRSAGSAVMIENAEIDPRRRFMPPFGWEKHKKAFSFYRVFPDAHAEVWWEPLRLKWVCRITKKKMEMSLEYFKYSYDAFNFPAQYLEGDE